MGSFRTAINLAAILLGFQTNRFLFLFLGFLGLCFLIPVEMSAGQLADQRSIGEYR